MSAYTVLVRMYEVNVFRTSLSKCGGVTSQLLNFPENWRLCRSVIWYTTSSHIQENMVTVCVLFLSHLNLNSKLLTIFS